MYNIQMINIHAQDHTHKVVYEDSLYLQTSKITYVHVHTHIQSIQHVLQADTQLLTGLLLLTFQF